MCQFADLTAIDRRLYRGSHGAAARAIMALAVGPVRAVAEYIRDNNFDVDEQLRGEVFAYFRRALAQPGGQVDPPGAPRGEPFVHVPGTTLAEQLGRLLQLPHVAANVFTAFERVLYEPGAQVNAPRTDRLLESVSRNPRVAILYAYGIDPNGWFQHQTVTPWRGRANQDAFVAVLPETRGLDAQEAVRLVPGIAAPNGLTVEEMRRRMERDDEVLLTDAVPTEMVVPLPPFDDRDSEQTLTQAAAELVRAEVASW